MKIEDNSRKGTDMTLELMNSSSKRRDKLVIMSEIVAIAKKGTSKTQIMFKANLSFSQLNQYLSLLSRTGLLEKKSDRGKVIFQATAKGLEFIDKQQQVFNLLNDDSYVYENCPKTNSSFIFTNILQGNKKFQVFTRKVASTY
jgi:predicted transcriptional regulator